MHFFYKFIIFIYIIHPQISFTKPEKIKKFYSTKYNEVNVRNGPGVNYFIVGKFLKKGIPVLVIDEFQGWKRIINFLGKEGWISDSQLSKKKYGITTKSNVAMKSFPKKNSKTKLILGNNLNFKIKKCINNWCKISVKNKIGWVSKSDFWGVF